MVQAPLIIFASELFLDIERSFSNHLVIYEYMYFIYARRWAWIIEIDIELHALFFTGIFETFCGGIRYGLVFIGESSSAVYYAVAGFEQTHIGRAVACGCRDVAGDGERDAETGVFLVALSLLRLAALPFFLSGERLTPVALSWAATATCSVSWELRLLTAAFSARVRSASALAASRSVVSRALIC